MNWFEIILLSALGCTFLWMILSLIANNKTYNHRIKLLNRISNRYSRTDEFWIYHKDFDDVTYDEHYKELFWFRDPWKLYSNRIQELMK